MEEGERITLDYSIGEHPTDPNTVVISIKGTGIKMTDQNHKRFMNILLNIMGGQMFAHAHGIPFEGVKHGKLPHKNSN